MFSTLTTFLATLFSVLFQNVKILFTKENETERSMFGLEKKIE